MAGTSPIITIDDFQAGIITDASVPARNAFQTLTELNIHDKPGILKLEGLPTAETEAAAPNDIDTLIQGFTSYTESGGTFRLIGYGSGGDIYVRSTGGTWTLQNTVSNSQGQGIVRYGTRAYYATNQDLGQINGDPEQGASYDDTFLSVTVGGSFASGATQTRRPMLEFAANLFVGDGRYVAKLESDYATWTNNALILPLNHYITAMASWNDRVAIGTSFGSGVNDSLGARVFFWDGESSGVDMVKDADTEGVSALFNLNEQLYMIGGRQGNLYLFDGNEWVLVRTLPNVSGTGLTGQAGMAQVNDNLFMAVNGVGIYRWGRPDTSIPYSLALAYRPSADQTNFNIGALNNFNNQLYFSWQDTDSGTFGVDAVHATNVRTGGVLETQIYEIENRGEDRLVKAVECVPRTFTANNSITVKYKLDNAASWSTLGTLTSSNIGQPLYGIFDRGKTIQLQLTFNTTDASENPEITKILIY